MNLETFFDKFATFAEAPDAIAKMRELIRTLGVSGRLFGGPKASGWSTVRMKEVCSQITDGEHATPHRISRGVPLATAKNVRDGFLDLANTDYVAQSTAEKCWKRCKPQPHDILMVCVGATTGRVCLTQNPPDIVLVRSVALIRPKAERIDPTYLDLFLRSSSGQAQIWENVKQSAQPCLYLGKMAEFEITLPPLAEQKRIVAKVDELMALCDRLEAQQLERETRHAALARASLSRFADAPTPANLQFLFHKYYDIPPADLRKSILTLAVQGKLVPQDPNDEPAEEVLAQNDERRRETAHSDHRADEENQPLLSGDDRWDIPETWSWRGLADLVLFVDYRGKTPHKLSNGVRLLTAKNVRKGQINLSPEEFLSEREYQAWMTRGFPKAGDVLFTTEAPMGYAAVVELTERFALAQRVICFQSYGALNPAFLVLQILSDQFQCILDKNGTGVTAKGIKASKLKQLPIAIPPLAEQRRIVAKVEQLMALVDELETHLAASHVTAKKLLEALVAELTSRQ